MHNASPESGIFLGRRSTDVIIELLPQTPITPEVSILVELEWLPEIKRDDLVGMLGTRFSLIIARGLYKMADRFTQLGGNNKT